MSYLAPIRY